MKKVALAIALVIAVAVVLASRWPSRAVKAPSDDFLQASNDTSLATALSLKDMAEQSDLIAIGSCVDTRSVWIDRSLVTLATINLDETIKGAATSPITVVLPGGADANRKFPVAMSYPGAPQIRPEEEVFLFLNVDSDFGGGYIIAGFSQGKFSIVTDEDGQRMVSRDLKKTILKSNNGVRRGTEHETPLSSFKAEVKKHLGQQ